MGRRTPDGTTNEEGPDTEKGEPPPELHADEGTFISSETELTFRQLEIEEKENTRRYQALAYRDQTTRRIAMILVGFLGFSFLSHYAVVTTLGVLGKRDAVDSVQTVFNIWLPVISGITSGAVAYYFSNKPTNKDDAP